MTFERRLLLAACGAWLVVALIGLATGPPLGHDEAAFAVAARGGGPMWLYRSSGVIAVARIGVALGGADWMLRLASVVLGLGVVGAVWSVGRQAFGERVGAWAAAVVAGAHPLVLRSDELIGDLPATACVLAGVAVCVGELDREAGPRWRLLAAAPAFAAGFYLRYGSAPVIAIAATTAAVLWWRSIARRPGPTVATAALFVALLAPHALQSLHTTGSVLGILEVSSGVPRRAYIGEGLVTYLTSNPFLYYGALVAPLLVAGLVAIVRPPPRWRPTIFLGTIALGQIVSIGLKSHGQPRYIFVATTLLVVLGVELVQRRFADRPRLTRAALPLVATAWLGAMVAIIPYNHYIAELRTPLAAATTAIHADAAGRPCIVIARVVPQFMWYTGCETVLVRALDHLPGVPPDRLVYVASVPHATTRVEPIAAALKAHPTPIPTTSELCQVWALR